MKDLFSECDCVPVKMEVVCSAVPDTLQWRRVMTLANEHIFFFTAATGLVLLHLLWDMIRRRSFGGFMMFSLLALKFALFLMEVLYLKIPLLDLVLAAGMGVLIGLHLLSVFARRRKR